jgi:hypothetical protein
MMCICPGLEVRQSKKENDGLQIAVAGKTIIIVALHYIVLVHSYAPNPFVQVLVLYHVYFKAQETVRAQKCL